MKRVVFILALCVAAPALAEATQQLDAHEHGVSTLNIAVEGTTVSMELFAPGADIVGFEHVATSDADLTKIAKAVATLDQPLDLFVMPDAASCTVETAQAKLEGEEDHDHGHDDHGHEEHADVDGHTEFNALYTLTCENPDQLKRITFAYFETFQNAQEVKVQIITASGAQAFEVERDAPVLDLEP